ncbi:MATE family efflux transporter [Maribellus maritimus]|uniref:MATE family efflux transporter n=1 Tax=Maribellus maritimus TaxID=2870838 RepID=UPI001EEC488B|nr:MATE family efflux transporter [Maribellus maritimus]MCG6185908.1 ATP-binding protein [Maribellus maritimus]
MKRSDILTNRIFKRYFLPTILMTMALSMGIIVDGIIVGNKLGSEALAVVNLSTPIVLGFNSIYVLMGVGGSVLAAIAIGQRNKNNALSYFHQAVLMMLLLSVIVLVVGLIFHIRIAEFIAGDTGMEAKLVSYIKILFLGAPLMIVVPGMACFIRTDNNPQLASVILIVANVVNLIFDLIYLFVFNMGVEGAALATVTGYGAGILVLVTYFFRETVTFQLKKPEMISKAKVLKIAATGLPPALTTLFLFFKIFLINIIVINTLGKSGMAVFSVCLSCLAFVSMFISGAAQTISPIIGVLYGEQDQQGIRFTIFRTFKIVGLASLCLIALFEIFPSQVLQLFGVRSGNELTLGVHAIRIFSVSLLGTAVNVVLMYYFQTIRQKKLSLVIAVVQGFMLVVPLAFVFSKIWGGSGIWMAFGVSEICTLFIVFILTRRIQKNSDTRLQGMLLLQSETSANAVLDVSIVDDIKNVARLSENVVQFCSEYGLNERTSMHVGLAVEELAVNSFQHGYRNRTKKVVDVRVSIGVSEVLISLKDDGIPFNPANYSAADGDSDFKSMGLQLVKNLAKEVNYTRMLGLNSTIIKF